MSSDENANLIRRYIETVWNEGNLDYIHEVWEADCVAECHANWESNRRFCPDGHFTIENLIAQGDKVVVRWIFRGRYAWEAKSQERHSMIVTGISMWTVQDGRLVDSYFASEGPGVYE